MSGYELTFRDSAIKKKYLDWNCAKKCWVCRKTSTGPVKPVEEWINKHWCYIFFSTRDVLLKGKPSTVIDLLLPIKGCTILCTDHKDYNPVPPGRPRFNEENDIILVTRTKKK